MPKMIEAPWTDHQVANLNRWQRCDHVHPFTCPNYHDGSRVLVAENNGWHCPSCEYRQTWAHAGMVLTPPRPMVLKGSEP